MLARLQGYSFQFVFQLFFLAYTLQLPSICFLPTAFKTFCWNKLGILTGRSWHFFNISSDMYAPRRMTVPHLMSARPMEWTLATLNASSPTMSHALVKTKDARIGVTCQGASSAPHFLLARLQGYSFQFVFQLVLPAYTLQLPSICVLPTAFKTLCSNKLGILTGRSWHFSNISSDTPAWWVPESTSLDASKANGMRTSHVKRIFSDNVTCFGKNKSCSNRSHLPQCFIKALRFLLA